MQSQADCHVVCDALDYICLSVMAAKNPSKGISRAGYGVTHMISELRGMR